MLKTKLLLNKNKDYQIKSAEEGIVLTKENLPIGLGRVVNFYKDSKLTPVSSIVTFFHSITSIIKFLLILLIILVKLNNWNLTLKEQLMLQKKNEVNTGSELESTTIRLRKFLRNDDGTINNSEFITIEKNQYNNLVEPIDLKKEEGYFFKNIFNLEHLNEDPNDLDVPTHPWVNNFFDKTQNPVNYYILYVDPNKKFRFSYLNPNEDYCNKVIYSLTGFGLNEADFGFGESRIGKCGNLEMDLTHIYKSWGFVGCTFLIFSRVMRIDWVRDFILCGPLKNPDFLINDWWLYHYQLLGWSGILLWLSSELFFYYRREDLFLNFDKLPKKGFPDYATRHWNPPVINEPDPLND